jgi:hypothetical protein
MAHTALPRAAPYRLFWRGARFLFFGQNRFWVVDALGPPQRVVSMSAKIRCDPTCKPRGLAGVSLPTPYNDIAMEEIVYRRRMRRLRR